MYNMRANIVNIHTKANNNRFIRAEIDGSTQKVGYYSLTPVSDDYLILKFVISCDFLFEQPFKLVIVGQWDQAVAENVVFPLGICYGKNTINLLTFSETYPNSDPISITVPGNNLANTMISNFVFDIDQTKIPLVAEDVIYFRIRRNLIPGAALNVCSAYLISKVNTEYEYLIKNATFGSEWDEDTTHTASRASLFNVISEIQDSINNNKKTLTGTEPIQISGSPTVYSLITPNITIQDASITQKGAVQLEDSLISSSQTKAATANTVKQLNDKMFQNGDVFPENPTNGQVFYYNLDDCWYRFEGLAWVQISPSTNQVGMTLNEHIERILEGQVYSTVLIPCLMRRSGIIVEAVAALSTLPTGQDFIIDIRKNGILSSNSIILNDAGIVIPTSQPSLNGLYQVIGDLDSAQIAVSKGDVLYFVIVQVGSPFPGSDLILHLMIQ